MIISDPADYERNLAWERNYERRCREELGEQVLMRMASYGVFEVYLHGELLPATFTLAELADVEVLISKVKSIVQEVA